MKIHNVFITFCLLFSGLAFAQTEQNQASQNLPSGNDQLAVPQNGDNVSITESVGIESSMPVPPEVQALSNDQKKQKAEEFLQEMRKVLEQVLSVLEEARKSKDIVRMNTINEKLTQIKGLLRISEQAEVNMKEAIAKGETKTVEHEFMKIQISYERIRNLEAEAASSSGELAVYAGDTQLEVNLAEGIASTGSNNTYFSADGSVTPTMQARIVQTVNNNISNPGIGGGTTTTQKSTTGAVVVSAGGNGGGGGGGGGGSNIAVVVGGASGYETNTNNTNNNTNNNNNNTNNTNNNTNNNNNNTNNNEGNTNNNNP